MTIIRRRTATVALAVAAMGATTMAPTAAAAPASAGTVISFIQHNISWDWSPQRRPGLAPSG